MSFAPLLQGGASLTSPTTITVSYNTGATYVGGLSTMLKEVDGNGNYFNSTIREVTTWTVGGTDDSRTVIQFPKPAAITGNVVIVSATLKMYCSNLIGGGGPVSIHRIVRPGFNIATATWLRYNGVDSWATPGGLGQGDGFNSSLDAGTPTLNAHNDYTSARMIADLQDGWNTQGYVTWIMKPTVEIGLSTKAINFRSHIDPVDTQRPLLEVTYYVDTGTTPSREVYGALLVPKKRTRQPQEAVQIDWSNPLTRGLVSATLPLFDAIKGRLNYINITEPRLLNTAAGRLFSGFNGTSAYIAYADQASRVVPPFTVAFSIFYGPGNYSAQALVAQGGAASGLGWSIRGNGENLGLTFGNVQDYNIKTSFFSPTASLYHVCVVVTGNGGVALAYRNGILTNSPGASIGTMLTPASTGTIVGAIHNNSVYGAFLQSGSSIGNIQIFNRALSANEVASLARNPHQIFKPTKQFLPVAITGISRPNSDELVTGWSASQSGFTLYDMVDEVSVNDSDYIISANTTAPALFNWDYPLTPGVYNINVRAERTGTTGDFRLVLEDSFGNVITTSNWQTLTQDLTTYTVTVNPLVTATRLRIETRASV